eukprot:c30921_g1_i1 orf=1-231(-)
MSKCSYERGRRGLHAANSTCGWNVNLHLYFASKTKKKQRNQSKEEGKIREARISQAPNKRNKKGKKQKINESPTRED